MLFGTLGYAIFSGAGFGFGSAFAGTLLNGGNVGQALRSGLKAGLIGGVTAGLTFGVGHVFFEGLPGIAGYAAKVMAHGTVQGFKSMAQGGKFEHGFLAGMFGKLGERLGPIGSIVAAGTASELGGGKFLNGAVSGAFVYLFNGMGDKLSSKLTYYINGLGTGITSAYGEDKCGQGYCVAVSDKGQNRLFKLSENMTFRFPNWTGGNISGGGSINPGGIGDVTVPSANLYDYYSKIHDIESWISGNFEKGTVVYIYTGGDFKKFTSMPLNEVNNRVILKYISTPPPIGILPVRK